MVFYFEECPTCKNQARNLVREVALQAQVKVDERYIYALPEVWKPLAASYGVPLPFIVNLDSKAVLPIVPDLDGMKDTLKAFLTD